MMSGRDVDWLGATVEQACLCKNSLAMKLEGGEQEVMLNKVLATEKRGFKYFLFSPLFGEDYQFD